MSGISRTEEGGGEFNEPFRVDSGDAADVLLGGRDQLDKDAPVGLALVDRRRWVNEHALTVAHCAVLAVLFLSCCILEKRRSDRLVKRQSVCTQGVSMYV